MRQRSTAASALVFAFAFAACGDAGTDADTGRDVSDDVHSDADVGADTNADAALDVPTDSDADADPDVATDADADTSPNPCGDVPRFDVPEPVALAMAAQPAPLPPPTTSHLASGLCLRTPADPRCARIDAAADAAFAFMRSLPSDASPHIGTTGAMVARLFERWDDYYWAVDYYSTFLDGADGPSELRVFERLVRPGTAVTDADFEQLEPGSLDQYTMPLAWCGDRPLTCDIDQALHTARLNGYYEMTHVLLAAQWAYEDGCELAYGEDHFESLLFETRALISGLEGTPTDLEFESAAFIRKMSDRYREPAGFLERTLTAQLPSGAWAVHDGGVGDYHPTILATWYLLEVAYGPSTGPTNAGVLDVGDIPPRP